MQDKTKVQFMEELVETRRRIAELMTAETEPRRAEEALKKYSERLAEIVELRIKELQDAREELNALS